MTHDPQKDLIPSEIVDFLDRYIVGQKEAKRMVAIALRNRWRRMQVSEDLRDEITPKNIIMIGPTGVGKTEIARRIAKLVHAPFVKVEASKFTEVGYVGRDVESMIRDLADIAVGMQKDLKLKEVRHKAEEMAELRLLDLLIPPDSTPQKEEGGSNLRDKFLEKLKRGELEDRIVEIDVHRSARPGIEFFPMTGNEGMDLNLQDLMSNLMPKQRKSKKTSIREARKIFEAEEAEKLVNHEDLNAAAVKAVEQTGIVFLDEIDKICSKDGAQTSGEVSREGVQRDLLPIVEGSRINTKYGPVNTDHILFIAAGAFHVSKPSDLIPEIQGRFPIRVELNSLTEEDFTRILKEPKNSLIRQYVALLETEGVKVEFDEQAIGEMAKIAREVNEKTENIGARRLHAVLEKLLEEVSFAAPEMPGQTVSITKQYVTDRLGEIAQDQDLSRYIL